MNTQVKRNQVLLIEDVDDLGSSGDLVLVKAGYARNCLLPQKKAVRADKHTLTWQAKLKAERAKRAEVDRSAAEVLAQAIAGMVHTIVVKVDPEGHMYGSVGAVDIVRLFAEQEIELTRRNVILPQPIKETGVHQISLRLKEGVPAEFTLKILSEAQHKEESRQI
jgi:large subunit ribosomal protein L9